MFEFNKLWYGICDALLSIVDALNSVFYWLAGILPADSMNLNDAYSPTGENAINKINESSLLSQIFSLNGIGKLFLFFIGLGLLCLGLAFVIGFLLAKADATYIHQ